MTGSTYVKQIPAPPGSNYHSQNIPLYNSAHDVRPIMSPPHQVHQPYQSGRPSSSSVQKGSGIQNKQPAPSVNRHMPGNVTPPQPITPVYAQQHPQPQLQQYPPNQYQHPPHRIVTLAPGP